MDPKEKKNRPTRRETMPFVANKEWVPKTAGKERNRSLGSAPSFSHWLPRRCYQGNPQNRKWTLLERIKDRQRKAGRRPDLTYYSSERGKKALEKRLVISNFQRDNHTKWSQEFRRESKFCFNPPLCYSWSQQLLLYFSCHLLTTDGSTSSGAFTPQEWGGQEFLSYHKTSQFKGPRSHYW